MDRKTRIATQKKNRNFASVRTIQLVLRTASSTWDVSSCLELNGLRQNPQLPL